MAVRATRAGAAGEVLAGGCGELIRSAHSPLASNAIDDGETNGLLPASRAWE